MRLFSNQYLNKGNLGLQLSLNDGPTWVCSYRVSAQVRRFPRLRRNVPVLVKSASPSQAFVLKNSEVIVITSPISARFKDCFLGLLRPPSRLCQSALG